MNSVLFSKTAAKTVRRLAKNIQTPIKKSILEIAQEPTRWHILVDPFRKLQIRSGHVTTPGGQYRVAYQFSPAKKEIKDTTND